MKTESEIYKNAFESLVFLLLSKGIISEQELASAMNSNAAGELVRLFEIK